MGENNLKLKCLFCNSTILGDVERASTNKSRSSKNCGVAFKEKNNSGRSEQSQSSKLGMGLAIFEKLICGGVETSEVCKLAASKVDLLKDGHSCCDSCEKALVEMGRLQELLQETQHQQKQIAVQLKQAMSDSAVAADQHIFKGETNENEYDSGGCNDDDDHHDDGFEWIVPEIEISKENRSTVQAKEFSPKIEIIVESKPDLHLQHPQTTVKKRFGCRRKLDKSAVKSPIQMRKCSVLVPKLNLKDIAMSRMSIAKKRSSEMQGLSKLSKRKRMEVSTKKPRKLMMYYIVSDDLLQLLCTPVKFQKTQLTCLETDCKYVTSGTDYSSFEEMTLHVVTKHEKDYNSKEIERACPLCEEKFTGGLLFRTHILNVHSNNGAKSRHLRLVLCESCHRPVAEIDHKLHVWRHKSDSEKLAAAKNGDYVPPRKKLTIYDQQLLSNENSSADQDKPKKIVGTRRVEEKRQQGFLAPTKKEDKQNREINKKETKKGAKERKVYYRASEELLILFCTQVKFQPTQLTCLETDCGYTAEGSDYSAFEKMTLHVVNEHEEKHKGKEYRKNCPVCGETFLSCKDFRLHIIWKHGDKENETKTWDMRLVICVSCCKPVAYRRYPYHAWSHKNDSEKMATVRNGDCVPAKAELSLRDKQLLKLWKSSEEDNNSALASTSAERKTAKQSKPVPGYIKGKSKRTLKEKSFLLIKEGLLYHNGVLIQYTEEEFICLGENCGLKLNGLQFTDFEKLRLHVKYGHNRRCSIQHRKCPLCDLEFDELTKVKCHLITEHSPPLVCPSCWKTFPDYDALSKHALSHNNPSIYKYPKDRKQHPERKKNSRGNYSCPICSREFDRITPLRTHEMIHIPDHLRERVTCSECGQKFLSQIALKGHMERIHHPELVTRIRECRVCGKQFNHKDAEKYRNHIRMHSGDTPFVCELCGRKFRNKPTFQEHVKDHSMNRSFQCDLCGKDYKHLRSLRNHFRLSHKKKKVS